MTDYTDLKAYLKRYADGVDPATVLEAIDAITALEADLADLQHDMGRAQAALSAMATDNERLRAALQKHDAALTAPSG